MSYHETFWAVVGTAAPIIALAAVVALPDSSTAVKELSQWSGIAARIRVAADEAHEALALVKGITDPSPEADSYEAEREFKRSYRLALANQLGSLVNVIVQAGLRAPDMERNLV